jgi:hypothetical protein
VLAHAIPKKRNGSVAFMPNGHSAWQGQVKSRLTQTPTTPKLAACHDTRLGMVRCRLLPVISAGWLNVHPEIPCYDNHDDDYTDDVEDHYLLPIETYLYQPMSNESVVRRAPTNKQLPPAAITVKAAAAEQQNNHEDDQQEFHGFLLILNFRTVSSKWDWSNKDVSLGIYLSEILTRRYCRSVKRILQKIFCDDGSPVVRISTPERAPAPPSGGTYSLLAFS